MGHRRSKNLWRLSAVVILGILGCLGWFAWSEPVTPGPESTDADHPMPGVDANLRIDPVPDRKEVPALEPLAPPVPENPVALPHTPAPGDVIAHGEYPNWDSFYRHAEDTCLTFVGEDWAERQLEWLWNGVSFKVLPTQILTTENGLLEEDVDDLRADIEPLDSEIRTEARRALTLFARSARKYARSGLEFSQDGRSSPLTQDEIELRNESEYTASSAIPCGGGSYRINFWSEAFPDLEGSLERIAELRAERMRVLRRYLN